MTDPKKLKHLQELSQKLNKQSDSLNATIVALEKRLADMNIGVSLWPAMSTLCDDEYSESVGPDEAEARYCECYALGYGKIGDQWRILCRREKYLIEDWQTASQSFEILERGPELPLVSAPRIVRLEAAKHLDELIEKLARKIESFIEDIQKANDALA